MSHRHGGLLGRGLEIALWSIQPHATASRFPFPIRIRRLAGQAGGNLIPVACRVALSPIGSAQAGWPRSWLCWWHYR